MRVAKSENFATGLFRMSRRPARGERWLIRKMENLDAIGSVLPSLNIKIPDMTGYWQPGGAFGNKVLWHLVVLNKRYVWTHGRNGPPFSPAVRIMTQIWRYPSARSKKPNPSIMATATMLLLSTLLFATLALLTRKKTR